MADRFADTDLSIDILRLDNGALTVASYSVSLSPAQLPSPFRIIGCLAFTATSDSLYTTMIRTTLVHSLSFDIQLPSC